MTFAVVADAYDRFMGRFAAPLAQRHAGLLGLRAGMSAIDVGCGTGAMTAELVAVLGEFAVVAVDPSAPFVERIRARFPGVDVRCSGAERLPFADASVDLAVAQLVVPFMADPAAGLAEMLRVTRPGGLVTATAWDHGGERSPLAPFWQAVHETDAGAPDESGQFGTHAGQLAQAFAAAGLRDIEESALTVSVPLDGPDDYWQPFTLGVGPAGAYVDALDAPARAELRDHCDACCLRARSRSR